MGEISLTEEIGTVIEDSGQMTVGSLVPALAQGFPQKRKENTPNGLGMAKQHRRLLGVYPLHLEANITKGMNRLYTENYKTVLRKVKEVL